MTSECDSSPLSSCFLNKLSCSCSTSEMMDLPTALFLFSRLLTCVIYSAKKVVLMFFFADLFGSARKDCVEEAQLATIEATDLFSFLSKYPENGVFFSVCVSYACCTLWKACLKVAMAFTTSTWVSSLMAIMRR